MQRSKSLPNLRDDANYEKIKKVMKDSSINELNGILGYCEDLVVSQDFIGDKRTSIFDAKAGMELNPNFFKIISWENMMNISPVHY